MQPCPAQSEGLSCCSHMPLQIALHTDLNVARIMHLMHTSTHQETKRIDSRGFRWFSNLSGQVIASFFFFLVRTCSLSSKAAVYDGAGSLLAVDLRQIEGLVAWCRHDEPVGNALFRKPMHVALTVCTVADELFLQLLEDCKALRESSTPNWSSQPFLTRFIGHGHFWIAAVCFRAWFSFGMEFFSVSASRSVLRLFFLSVVLHQCQLPGRQKSDTARCHGQREVNHAAPVALPPDNGPDFGMPAHKFLIKLYAWRHGACQNIVFLWKTRIALKMKGIMWKCIEKICRAQIIKSFLCI